MIRAIFFALAFFVLTLVLVPFQLVVLVFNLRLQRAIPHLYHRILCALIGVRIHEIGARSTTSPVLILSNHVSWLDICVISALTPVVFVAKREVAGWPMLGWLARLQRTIFINRQARGHFERRHARAAVPLGAGRRGASRPRRYRASYPRHRAADVDRL